MAHKTLIGGTAYEISGGKTLVNGTAYSIDKGKTLVGGTAYEVGFAEMVTVRVKGLGTVCKANTTINGEQFIFALNADELLTVPVGSTIVFTNTSMGNGTVYVTDKNGVQTSTSLSRLGTYSYTVIGNTNIERTGKQQGISPGVSDYVPLIYITEQ